MVQRHQWQQRGVDIIRRDYRFSVINRKYKLQEMIAQGGMGDVYRGLNVHTDRPVVVKLLRKINDYSTIRRFRQETRLVTTIDHENVCKIIEHGIHEGSPFLVMPYLRGAALSKVLKDKGKIEIRRAMDIACQTLRGLQALHNRGIIHRDIKPSNLFLCSETSPGRETVKILDLGISAELNNRLRQTTATVALGTVYYMAPERLADNVYSVKTDIYSVGVILYEMLTGVRPYDGSPFEAKHRIENAHAYMSPGRLNPRLSIRLEDIIMTAMSRAPVERFDNADAMRVCLERTHVTPADEDTRIVRETSEFAREDFFFPVMDRGE